MKYIYTYENGVIDIGKMDGFEIDTFIPTNAKTGPKELVGICAVKYFGVETIDELKGVEGIESKRKFMVTSYEDPANFDARDFLMELMKTIKNMEDGSVVECITGDSDKLEIRVR